MRIEAASQMIHLDANLLDQIGPADHRSGDQIGMPVEIFIETGERTFAEYLLQPMELRINRAFKER